MVALSFAAGCASKPALPASSPSPLVGSAVPDFRRPTLDGATFDTKAERGHVVVVKFFAKYCEPCRKTLPETERLHRARPEITIVGVDEDEHESDARAPRRTSALRLLRAPRTPTLLPWGAASPGCGSRSRLAPSRRS